MISKTIIGMMVVVLSSINLIGQGIINITIRNKSITSTSFRFEVWAAAGTGYTSPNNNWSAMNIRMDVNLDDGLTISSGTNAGNNMVVDGAEFNTSVPGAPPAGSVEFGMTYTRSSGLELTSTPIKLSDIIVSVSGVGTVKGSDITTLRTTNTSTGSFWTNAADGLVRRSFSMPANFLLPVSLSHFSVVKSSTNEVEIKWTAEQEINISHYEIERSQDALSWTKIAELKARAADQSAVNYNYLDQKLNEYTRSSNKIYYYRIKSIELDLSSQYSPVRNIHLNDSPRLFLLQNPVQAQLLLRYENMVEDHVNIRVLDAAGRQIINNKYIQIMNTGVVNLQSDLSALISGHYFLQINGKNNLSLSLPFIKE